MNWQEIKQHREELQSLIRNNQGPPATTTELHPENELRAIEEEDENDCNAILSAVNYGNYKMFAYLECRLSQVHTTCANGGNLIKRLIFKNSDDIYITDNKDNNVLHLAMRSQHHQLIVRIADLCEEYMNIEERGELISSINNDDESPISLAIINRNEPISNRWLDDMEEHPNNESYTIEENVRVLHADGNNCLIAAIRNELDTIATRLFNVFIPEAKEKPYYTWTRFIGPLIKVVRGADANIIYCVAMLVDYDCTELVDYLFSHKKFRREFYQKYDHKIMACKYFSAEMRRILFPHCKRVDGDDHLFADTYYLITKKTLYALFIYDPKRKYGQEQLENIRRAFNNCGFYTFTLKINDQLTTDQFNQVLKEQLLKFTNVSLLVTCVMSHGREGYMQAQPDETIVEVINIFLFNILEGINEHMEENTVKVSIFTCCRPKDKDPTLEQLEQTYKMGVGLHGYNNVLMTSCAAGEKSVKKQPGYTDHLAKLLNSGEREFHVMHRKIAALMKDPSMALSKKSHLHKQKDQNPVYTEKLLKPHLLLPPK